MWYGVASQCLQPRTLCYCAVALKADILDQAYGAAVAAILVVGAFGAGVDHAVDEEQGIGLAVGVAGRGPVTAALADGGEPCATSESGGRQEDGAGLLHQRPLLGAVDVVGEVDGEAVAVDAHYRIEGFGALEAVGEEDKPLDAAHGGFGIAGAVGAVDGGGRTAVDKVVPLVARQRAPGAGGVGADGVVHAPVGVGLAAAEALDVVVAVLLRAGQHMPAAAAPGEEVDPAGVGVGHEGVVLPEVVVLVLGEAEGAAGRTLGGGVAAEGAELQVARREEHLMPFGHAEQGLNRLFVFDLFAFASGKDHTYKRSD